MSYEVYKIIHLVAIVLLFSGLVGLLTIQMSGGVLAGKARSMVFLSHGIGLMLLLISGFGLLARLGLTSGLPGWIYAKLIIWFILGAAISVVKRKGIIGWPIFISLIAIFTIAAVVAITKPF